MDFTPSEASADLAALTRRILADKLTHDPHGTGGFDTPLWTALGQAGVLDAALPSSLGGGGFGLLEQCAVLTEIGRAVAAVPYLTSITMAASALAEFGTPELVDRWVLPVLRGERVLTVALPDPGAPYGFRVTGDRLTGTQSAVPFGAFAHGFLVAAPDEVFLVDAAAPGSPCNRSRRSTTRTRHCWNCPRWPGFPSVRSASGCACAARPECARSSSASSNGPWS